MKNKDVDAVLSEMMRNLASKLTHDQRVANGRKAWQSRKRNLAAKMVAGRLATMPHNEPDTPAATQTGSRP